MSAGDRNLLKLIDFSAEQTAAQPGFFACESFHHLEQSGPSPRSFAAKSRIQVSQRLHPMLLHGGRDDSNRHQSQDLARALYIEALACGSDFIVSRTSPRKTGCA
jgi:hypothetical protein